MLILTQQILKLVNIATLHLNYINTFECFSFMIALPMLQILVIIKNFVLSFWLYWKDV